jgi:hypothetical protein
MSVWTPYAPKPLLLMQMELEARVGIERSSLPIALHKPLEIKRLFHR